MDRCHSILLSIKGWFTTTGPQTNMQLYFRSKANSRSFLGSLGIHHAHTAARGFTHIREMRATTPPWIALLGQLVGVDKNTPFPAMEVVRGD